MPWLLITAIGGIGAYIGSLTTTAAQPSPIYNGEQEKTSSYKMVLYAGIALSALYIYKKVK